MDSVQTLALWRQGKADWEIWAKGASEKRRALVQSGLWSVDWYGEGQNDETKAWLADATADFCEAEFETGADFSGVNFPGPVDFDRARFGAAASFCGARFGGNVTAQRAQFLATSFINTRFEGFANFDKARFGADVSFEKALFLKVSDMEPCARFNRAEFSASADFTAAQFIGTAQFVKTAFSATTFDKCEFKDDAIFTGAHFDAAVTFVKARFSGAQVDFTKAQFRSDTRFLDTHFGGSWAGSMISGACSVSFEEARFDAEASFRNCWLIGESEFRDALFKGMTKFDGAMFVMPASFAPVVFSCATSFRETQFVHGADFGDARFLEECDFGAAKFGGDVRFAATRFAGPARFAGTEFSGEASFAGAVAEAAFSLDGTRYTTKLDFTGMTTAEPVNTGRMVKFRPKRGLFGWLFRRRNKERRSFAERWASLKPSTSDIEYRPPAPPSEVDEPDVVGEPLLPVESKKTTAAEKIASAAGAPAPDAEAAASDGETKSEAPVTKQEALPTPTPTEKDAAPKTVKGFRVLRFGRTTVKAPPEPITALSEPASASLPSAPVAAEAGPRIRRRSVVRPVLLWLLAVLAFTPLYLAQRPASHSTGEAWRLTTWPAALSWEGAPPWLAASAGTLWDGVTRLSGGIATAYATGPCITGDTQATGEALYLSAKNSLVFVPWESEQAMRRTYGCLYGLEGAKPIIPVQVSHLALLQALVSAIILAMLGLAVRDRVQRA